MLTVEPGASEPPVRCDDCGGNTTTLTGYVHKDGDAFAVYFARLSADHPERAVQALVGIGDRGEGTSEVERRAFALEMRKGPDGVGVQVVEGSESPWQRQKVLGRFLSREEALRDPALHDVFHITDHMFTDDPTIREHFTNVGG